jgi:hypothetical protein
MPAINLAMCGFSDPGLPVAFASAVGLAKIIFV